jgi:predicted nucleic acid-binding protein
MTGKFFLDTNFLVYCFSADEPAKRERCLAILQMNERKTVSFVISTQVVNEFASVLLNKFKLPPARVKTLVHDLGAFEIVKTDLPVISEAISIHALHQISFWDSLIISAAKTANCTAVLTEDMADGSTIFGVTILNPFTLVL